LLATLGFPLLFNAFRLSSHIASALRALAKASSIVLVSEALARLEIAACVTGGGRGYMPVTINV
jgi:hypothetical protein